MSVGFYSAFEDKHRGSRDLIKTRLRVYLPFVEPLKTLSAQCFAVDLGCGRGEWLELLADIGITAKGVDLDDGMLAPSRELGLSVETADAITFLQTLPDESTDVVSGFHLAEHLPFGNLQALVNEALRVLKPAGLLILETPNPENIRVGTTNFYLDPTHQRPLPPQLLAFLPEHYGFSRTKILRLQESPELAANPAPTLMSVLDGASPDYAVVAQKAAAPEVLECFDAVFAKEYGLCVEELAIRFEANMQGNFSGAIQLANRTVEQMESLARQAEARAQALQHQLVDRNRRIDSLNQSIADRDEHILDFSRVISERDRQISKLDAKIDEYHQTISFLNQVMIDPLQEISALTQSVGDRDVQIAQLSSSLADFEVQTENLSRAVAERDGQIAGLNEVVADRDGQIVSLSHAVADRDGQIAHLHCAVGERDGQLSALINSRSWRATRPVRECAQLLRRVRNQARAMVREVIKSILARAISFAKARPMLKIRLTAWVKRYPMLEARLRRSAAARGLGHSPVPYVAPKESSSQAATGQYPAGFQELTPHARCIYAELKAAIEANRKEGGR